MHYLGRILSLGMGVELVVCVFFFFVYILLGDVFLLYSGKR